MGIPDKMYGAKAIVVIKATPTNSSPEIREEMKNSVPKFLGPDYMVGGVVFLSELGLSDWRTNSMASSAGMTLAIRFDGRWRHVLSCFPT